MLLINTKIIGSLIPHQNNLLLSAAFLADMQDICAPYFIYNVIFLKH